MRFLLLVLLACLLHAETLRLSPLPSPALAVAQEIRLPLHATFKADTPAFFPSSPKRTQQVPAAGLASCINFLFDSVRADFSTPQAFDLFVEWLGLKGYSLYRVINPQVKGLQALLSSHYPLLVEMREFKGNYELSPPPDVWHTRDNYEDRDAAGRPGWSHFHSTQSYYNVVVGYATYSIPMTQEAKRVLFLFANQKAGLYREEDLLNSGRRPLVSYAGEDPRKFVEKEMEKQWLRFPVLGFIINTYVIVPSEISEKQLNKKMARTMERVPLAFSVPVFEKVR